MKTNETSATLMEIAGLNPQEFAKLKGSERRAAHATLLALLAQVTDGDERIEYLKRSQRAYAAVGVAA